MKGYGSRKKRLPKWFAYEVQVVGTCRFSGMGHRFNLISPCQDGNMINHVVTTSVKLKLKKNSYFWN